MSAWWKENLLAVKSHLRQRPLGIPTEDDFQLVKVDIPDLKAGEFLLIYEVLLIYENLFCLNKVD